MRTTVGLAVLLAVAALVIGGCPKCKDGDGKCYTDECTFENDSDCPACDPSIGLLEPANPCTKDDPCKDLQPSYVVRRIRQPSDVPECMTKVRNRPDYDDGPPLEWTDFDGVTRYRCEFRPDGTTAESPRPLVIFAPGSGAPASSAYDRTLLRDKAEDFDLSGDPDRSGYVFVSIQARNLHWPTNNPQDGAKFDSYHRDLSTDSGNPDVAFFDHVIDSLAAEGVIDPSRIYVTGWSNGTRFAAMYGIGRHETPTPGGHRVAAVAGYSGGDPYANAIYGLQPSCEQDPLPESNLPFLLLSRTCDIMACDEEHDFEKVPGNVMDAWVDKLLDEIGAEAYWTRIDDDGNVAYACEERCKAVLAGRNHLHWPDGLADGGGIDHEPDMLSFLREHPLP